MTDWDRFLVLLAALVSMVGLFYGYAGRVRPARGRRRVDGADARQPTVLVLWAGVGGGHEAAARAVAAALEAAGRKVTTLDGLRQVSPRLDAALRWTYAARPRHAPWVCAIVLRVLALPGIRNLLRLASGLLYGDRLLRIVAEVQPDLIVSTYPVLTTALGYLRRRSRLSIPVVAIVSDYGVHPMGVAPGVDRHLMVSTVSLPAAGSAGRRAEVIEPPVGPAFRVAPERGAARAALGLPADGFLALIVGGASGIGDLAGAAERALRAGVGALIVTGHNEALRAQLERQFGGEPRVRVYGWAADMPRLMAAVDCLIQNAGGLPCLEAVHLQLPILIYEAIPGYDQLNAAAMERAGAARWLRRADELEVVLRDAAAGTAPLAPPRREPGRPVAEAVLGALQAPPAPAAAPAPRRRWTVPARRALVGASALGALVLLTFSSWSVALAARGLGMEVPGANPRPGLVAFGVRATDPQTARAVEMLVEQDHLTVTIFVDQAAVAGLAPASGLSFGVAENPNASVLSDPWRVRQEMRQTVIALHAATGAPVKYFLPARQDVNLTALAVIPPPAHLVIPEQFHGKSVQPGVYVIDVSGLPAGDAEQVIQQQLAAIREKGLQCVSLAQLAS